MQCQITLASTSCAEIITISYFSSICHILPRHQTADTELPTLVRVIACVAFSLANFAAQLTSPSIRWPTTALLSPKWSAPEPLASPVHWQIVGAVPALQPLPRARRQLDQPGHWAGEKVFKRSTIRQISCMLYSWFTGTSNLLYATMRPSVACDLQWSGATTCLFHERAVDKPAQNRNTLHMQICKMSSQHAS